VAHGHLLPSVLLIAGSNSANVFAALIDNLGRKLREAQESGVTRAERLTPLKPVDRSVTARTGRTTVLPQNVGLGGLRHSWVVCHGGALCPAQYHENEDC